MEALAAEAERLSASLFYETAARGLVRSGEGEIVGVEAVQRGRPRHLMGRVVLASGGFEGNPEMLARYIGPKAQWTRPVARGGYYNRGEGVAMGLAAGAAPAGEFGAFHAQPVDPRSGAIEPVVLHYGYGVLVNREGQRFTDEAAGPVDAGYERVARAVLEQPEGLAWAVFDAGLDDAPRWRVTVRSDREPLEAPTVEALAGAAGLDPAALSSALAAYNAACPEDASAFRPDGPDGLATRGLAPPKSNWARPLVRPPFRAWPVICANCFTFGGLRIDANGRAIDLDGDPIPGLYAAGETAGLYYGDYTGRHLRHARRRVRPPRRPPRRRRAVAAPLPGRQGCDPAGRGAAPVANRSPTHEDSRAFLRTAFHDAGGRTQAGCVDVFGDGGGLHSHWRGSREQRFGDRARDSYQWVQSGGAGGRGGADGG